jgi:hypothetical protein
MLRLKKNQYTAWKGQHGIVMPNGMGAMVNQAVKEANIVMSSG